MSMSLVDAVIMMHDRLRAQLGVVESELRCFATTRGIEQMKEECGFPDKTIPAWQIYGMPIHDIGDADGYIAAWVGVQVNYGGRKT